MLIVKALDLLCLWKRANVELKWSSDRSGGKSTYLAQQDKLPFVSNVKGKLRTLDVHW